MEVNTEAGAIAELEAEVASYMGWGRASGWEGVVATPGGMHGAM